ncbi:hypothetical protein KI387_038124 [Taxus chinensis]|uniref:MACPF domain-containing protein n=1 Tax=Taxus chinensis TaxID=29808 RepID=A0AA38FWH6_TAXCH|nr:hypothetical protein KI387_038124 [Taxus chinensis]
MSFNTALSSVQALGRGFDATSDIRLLYCKGLPGSRLVEVDEEHTRDVEVFEGISVPFVSKDIKCLQGESSRSHTGVLNFHQMAEHFNQPFSLSGKIPLGNFNAMFNFSGSWQADRASTKSLAVDGVSIALYTFRLTKFPLILCEDVKRAVPLNMGAYSFSKFPEKIILPRAIGLYLEYKPPIEELRYFLEFQVPRAWAPLPSQVPGQQRKEPICPSLQFSLMGPKLYICTFQVSVGRRLVTGLRLGLEGKKCNRLVIQLQHLTSLPKILRPYWDAHIPIGPPKWQGPEEQDSRWFEPVKWKNFSHVSTAPVENSETWIGDLSGVYIVTGAQLGVWDFGQKSVLHLRLLYSKVPGCTIRRSVWDHTPSPIMSCASSSNQGSMKSDSLASANSGSESTVQIGKFAKIVDLMEITRGPHDMPGHWMVSGAKLGVQRGKIVLRVKYSLLNY